MGVMGRPSKLSDQQREEAIRRAAQGETVSGIARDMGVHHSQISRVVSHKVEKITSLATTLANTEVEISHMGRAEQVAVRSLADQMKLASNSLAAAAVNGAQINERLTGLAVKRLNEINEQSSPEDLKPIAALVATGNEASKTALALVNANKGQAQGETSLEDLLEQVNRRQHG